MGLVTQLSYSKYAKKATGKCCDTLLPVNLLILDLWPKIPQNANPNFAGRAFIYISFGSLAQKGGSFYFLCQEPVVILDSIGTMLLKKNIGELIKY